MLHDSPAKAKTVLVIDLSNMAHRAWHAAKELKTRDGLLSGQVYGSMNMLLRIFRDVVADVCPIFCYDGKNSKRPRLEILPTYKGNRDPDRFNPVPEAKELVLNLPGLHIEKEETEGDDACAWAVNLVKEKPVVLFTGDTDMWSLMRYPNVRVYSPNKNRFIEKADWVEKYHVEDPAKIYMAKSLFGDTGDFIKGVERLIKKQVEPILNDEKCVDLSAFYDMIAEQPESMSDKMWRKTLEAKEQVFTNYSVIIPRTKTFDKTAVKRTLKNEENCKKLLNVLKKYECVSKFTEAEALYNE